MGRSKLGDGQEGLACCDSWGRNESDMTERLNWTELIDFLLFPDSAVLYPQSNKPVHIF